MLTSKLSRFGSIVGSAILSFGLLLPVAVYGHEGEVEQPHDQKQQVAQADKGAVCQSFDQLGNKLRGNYEQRQSKVKESRIDQKDKVNEHREDATNKVKETREKWDTTREENFTKLRQKATTNEQKAAVETYVAAVHAAISARRAAYDQAHETFKAGVQAATDSHKTQTDATLATLRASIDAAVARAKTACAAANPDKAAILRQLQTDIKAAQETFKGTHQSGDKLKGQIKPLIDARKAAHEAANQTFKSAMEAARTTLKATFGNTPV